ncbi:MAG: thiamine-phosphate kinase, partial [Polyangiaceae bacterium]
YLQRLFFVRAEGEIGIGDDAAILRASGSVVWTIDEQAENTHFRRDWLSWKDVGYRSFVAAVSDIAAMGAVATHALTALALPLDFRDEDFLSIAEGQAEAARATCVRIVGGNMARATEAHVTTTVIGNGSKPILRSGAKVGDGVFVAGTLGLAGLGMRALERNVKDAKVARAVSAWRRPPILIDASKTMSAHASAAIDVSDGLARDLAHVAEASRARIALDEAALLAIAKSCGAEEAARALGEDVLDAILHGGEDYALVVTCDREIEGFSRIGSVVAGKAGVTIDSVEIEPRGFDHF